MNLQNGNNQIQIVYDDKRLAFLIIEAVWQSDDERFNFFAQWRNTIPSH